MEIDRSERTTDREEKKWEKKKKKKPELNKIGENEILRKRITIEGEKKAINAGGRSQSKTHTRLESERKKNDRSLANGLKSSQF